MVNGWIAYSAKVITMIATSAGLRMTTYIQAQMNDGSGPQYLCMFPNASSKYEYSAPDFPTTVPSSAKDNAPKNRILDYKSKFHSKKLLVIK